MKEITIKMYRGDVLIHDFILCANPEGRIGWYDYVTEEFHDHTENLLKPPFVEHSGTQYIDTGVSAMREHHRWISVNERLPVAGERILATDGAFVGEMYINKRGQWQRYNVNDHSLLMALDILWWMPLPEPPKEGE